MSHIAENSKVKGSYIHPLLAFVGDQGGNIGQGVPAIVGNTLLPLEIFFGIVNGSGLICALQGPGGGKKDGILFHGEGSKKSVVLYAVFQVIVIHPNDQDGGIFGTGKGKGADQGQFRGLFLLIRLVAFPVEAVWHTDSREPGKDLFGIRVLDEPRLPDCGVCGVDFQ